MIENYKANTEEESVCSLFNVKGIDMSRKGNHTFNDPIFSSNVANFTDVNGG